MILEDRYTRIGIGNNIEKVDTLIPEDCGYDEETFVCC